METKKSIKTEEIEATAFQSESPNPHHIERKFEEFKEQMSMQLQEYIKQQDEAQKLNIEEFKEQMNMQLQEYIKQQDETRIELITLRKRFKELEVDSTVKGQTIKILRQDVCKLEELMPNKKENNLLDEIVSERIKLSQLKFYQVKDMMNPNCDETTR